jgi:chromosome segregation ATPase
MRTIQQITAEQTQVQAKREALFDLMKGRESVLAGIERDIAAAQGKVASLQSALADVLARHAMNEATDADVATARREIAAAEKELTVARKGEAEAAEIKLTLASLRTRLQSLNSQLADLNAQEAEARKALAQGVIDGLIAEYREYAAKLGSAHASVFAAIHALRPILGHDVTLNNDRTNALIVPAFGANPDYGSEGQFEITQGNHLITMKAAQARVAGLIAQAGI